MDGHSSDEIKFVMTTVKHMIEHDDMTKTQRSIMKWLYNEVKRLHGIIRPPSMLEKIVNSATQLDKPV